VSGSAAIGSKQSATKRILRGTPITLISNPVKHGLVARVRDWPFSSFHRMVRLGVYPEDWAGGGDDAAGAFGERTLQVRVEEKKSRLEVIGVTMPARSF
jgi:hypothetical protein